MITLYDVTDLKLKPSELNTLLGGYSGGDAILERIRACPGHPWTDGLCLSLPPRYEDEEDEGNHEPVSRLWYSHWGKFDMQELAANILIATFTEHEEDHSKITEWRTWDHPIAEPMRLMIDWINSRPQPIGWFSHLEFFFYDEEDYA